MTHSQNGWTAGDTHAANVGDFVVPGTQVVLPLNRTAGPVLVAFAVAYNAHVQKLHPNDCWGWANRDIRGSSTVVSNHASGTAMDLNANEHPLGTADLATFTAAQVATIHQLLTTQHGLIRWGGDYHGRLDGQHFEINVTPAQFAAATKNSRPPFPGVLRSGASGAAVVTLQRRLVALGVQMAVDGAYGPTTVAAVTHFQMTHHLTQDGVVGAGTWAALFA